MRKTGFMQESWNQYLNLIGKFIPTKTKEKLGKRKTIYIILCVLTIDIIIALAIYLTYF